MPQMEFAPIQPYIGAEVSGVDLREGLGDDTISALRAAWIKYKVLVFRNQDITREQHKGFARAFGQLEAHPALAVPEHPEIVAIKMLDGMKIFRRLQEWHTDVTYTEKPPSGAVLRGITIPGLGGDTVFANAAMAYETLDDATKARIAELRAVHEPDFTNYVTDPDQIRVLLAANPPREHPLVTVHPETGERVLFINEHFTKRIAGLPETESRQLLDRLFHHLAHPEFQVRIRWRPNTIVMWDERSTQHYAVTDYDEPRYLERILIAGQRPRGIAHAAAA